MPRTSCRPHLAAALALAALLSAGCKQEPSKLDPVLAASPPAPGSTEATAGSDVPATAGKDIDSKDILARPEGAPEVHVKHVLIGWKDLAEAYGGQIDPRAAKRTNDQAAALALELAGKLKANPAGIDALVKEHSEDPGSQGGEPYEVKAATKFVPEFKQLALRLKLGEVGIVKTSFGYHVMMRVPPPKPDPLQSSDIMNRTEVETGTVQVQHVLIGWKGAPGARDATRTKEEADKLALDVLAQVRANGDMAALMKQYSEDPGSKDNARIYDVEPGSPMVEPFKQLSLRLKLGEAGLVKSPFGWHVIKRVPPAAPDSLESADILAREPVTQTAKVKHILLGWTEVHAEDERGKKRDRATLERLVKETVNKLRKGAKIEPLMAQLSEDPGSAKTGKDYDVTPDAGLVPPFKNLSLRLKPGEVGVVKTDFGIHIIQRVDGMPGAKPSAAGPTPTIPGAPQPPVSPHAKPVPPPKAPASPANKPVPPPAKPAAEPATPPATP